jgi:autotransporter-associated beta strand protein
MKTITGATHLIILAAATAVFATTAFAQTQKNYTSGVINVTPANVSTTTLNGVINSISGTAVVNITAPNVRVTTVSGGTLNVGATSGAAGSTRTTVTTLSGGRVTVNTAGFLILTAGSSVKAVAITNNGRVVFNQTVSGTYAGVISGQGALQKTGPATLILTGANTYTGLTTVNEGTLRGDTTSLPGDIHNNALVQFNQASAGTYAGVIFGTGQLQKIGAGVLTLTGANTYTGLTGVSDGVLSGNTTSLRGEIVNNAVVQFNEANSGTYAGVMSGTGTLLKAGLGSVSFSGTNSYTGVTQINAGTLFIEGDQQAATGAVTTASGATLGGKGIIGGATTIASGGSHRIGASESDNQAGYQTFTSALTYAAGSQAFWRLMDNTTVPETAGIQNFDQVGVGTSLTVSPTATFNLAFNTPGSSTVKWSDTFWDADKLDADGWLVFSASEILPPTAAVLKISAPGQDVFTLNPASEWLDSEGVLLSVARPGYTFAFYKDQAAGELYLNYIYGTN